MPDARTAVDRADGGAETSINWEDTPEVLARTYLQSGSSVGVARVLRAELDRISRGRNLGGGFHAERKIDDPQNPHHGNLVYGKALTRTQIKAIANTLALEATYCQRPPRGSDRDSRG